MNSRSVSHLVDGKGELAQKEPYEAKNENILYQHCYNPPRPFGGPLPRCRRAHCRLSDICRRSWPIRNPPFAGEDGGILTFRLPRTDLRDIERGRTGLLDLRAAQYKFQIPLAQLLQFVGYSAAGHPPSHFIGRLNRHTSSQKWTYIADDLYE